jgi:hypothetical protein
MVDVGNHKKRPEDDLGVVIKDDVWVGTRAVFLLLVTIGRGQLSQPLQSSPAAFRRMQLLDVQARVLKFRWDVDTILSHEAALYPEEQRFSKAELESWQK